MTDATPTEVELEACETWLIERILCDFGEDILNAGDSLICPYDVALGFAYARRWHADTDFATRVYERWTAMAKSGELDSVLERLEATKIKP